MMSEAVISIKGTLTKNAADTDIFEFTNNAGAILFYSINNELNGKDSGIVSLLKDYLCNEKDNNSVALVLEAEITLEDIW